MLHQYIIDNYLFKKITKIYPGFNTVSLTSPFLFRYKDYLFVHYEDNLICFCSNINSFGVFKSSFGNNSPIKINISYHHIPFVNPNNAYKKYVAVIEDLFYDYDLTGKSFQPEFKKYPFIDDGLTFDQSLVKVLTDPSSPSGKQPLVACCKCSKTGDYSCKICYGTGRIPSSKINKLLEEIFSEEEINDCPDNFRYGFEIARNYFRSLIEIKSTTKTISIQNPQTESYINTIISDDIEVVKNQEPESSNFTTIAQDLIATYNDQVIQGLSYPSPKEDYDNYIYKILTSGWDNKIKE